MAAEAQGAPSPDILQAKIKEVEARRLARCRTAMGLVAAAQISLVDGPDLTHCGHSPQAKDSFGQFLPFGVVFPNVWSMLLSDTSPTTRRMHSKRIWATM